VLTHAAADLTDGMALVASACREAGIDFHPRPDGVPRTRANQTRTPPCTRASQFFPAAAPGDSTKFDH
jgi:hypothetical protein